MVQEAPPSRRLTLAGSITLLCLVMYHLPAAEGRPQILFLHSYHKAEWTDELMRGYLSVLERRGPCDFSTEYMDTKKNQSPEYLSQLEALYRLKYASVRFQIVLASDDNAFHFALERQTSLFHGAPIVFCGVNNFSPGMLKDHPNATGVVERGDFRETLSMAMRWRPRTRVIRVITDSTETARTNLAGLEAVLKTDFPQVRLEKLEGISLETLSRELSHDRDDAIGFFIAFWKDESGQPITPQALGDIFKRSTIPIFGRSEWMIGRGMLGGMCVTGFHQGEAAAGLAARILDGTPAGQLPVITDSPNKFLFDYPEMEKFGLTADDLPPGSLIFNEPRSLYRENKATIWVTGAALILLTVLVILLGVNILNRRRIEAQLRNEQAKLSAAFEQTFQLMGLLDLEGRLVSTNRAALTIIGAEERQVQGKFFWETPWWTHDPALQKTIRGAVANAAAGKTSRFVATHLDTKGQLHHVDFSLKPVLDSSGQIQYLMPEGRDISEEQRTLQALRDSEERFRQLSENIHEVFWLRDCRDQRVLYVSPAFEAVYDRKVADLYEDATTWQAAIHPDDRDRVCKAFHSGTNCVEGEVEYRIQRRDGTIRWIRDRAFPIRNEQGETIRMAGLAEDVTEQRQAREVLRASEERFRSVVQSSPMGIHLYRLHEDNRLIFIGANPAADAILGIDHASLAGKTIEEAFPSLKDSEVANRYREACLEGRPWQTEQIFYADERIQGAYEVRAFQIAPRVMASMFLDITHRKEMEAALRESERRYRSTFEQAPIGIASVSLGGRFLRVNQRFCDITGFSRTEMLNGAMEDLLNPMGLEIERKDRETLRTGNPSSPSAELPIRRKDGSEVWVNRTISLLNDEQGRPQYFVEILEDITARRALEERLRQSQKLEAIGQLAGGVAHDFNNQLTAIIGYAELLSATIADARLKGYASNVVESARKSASLTRQLLAFARKGKYESVEVNMHTLIDEVIAILERSIDKRIRIHRILKAHEARITGDPGLLQNALLNLGLNARDAMPEGGQITFESADVEAGSDPDLPSDAPAGRYLRLQVRDTGTGIPQDVRDRIFEPFFTTKEQGKGTGLGLAAVYGTAQQHRGAVTFQSEPGRGSCFSLFLPITAPPAPMREAPAAQERAWKRGRVLVIDDEQLVRDLTSTLLEEMGHTVETRENGRLGVEFYRENWKTIDLVVLDMIMPEMDGRTALKLMREVNPHLRVLLVSGFSSDAERNALAESDVVGFLHKPYKKQDFEEKVARLMAGG